ncbi:hypothetical protein Tco_1386029 [Tanacetum coccineum]
MRQHRFRVANDSIAIFLSPGESKYLKLRLKRENHRTLERRRWGMLIENSKFPKAIRELKPETTVRMEPYCSIGRSVVPVMAILRNCYHARIPQIKILYSSVFRQNYQGHEEVILWAQHESRP